ncbi:hypothetical protein BKI52_35340 [marine bacterium AO1-C]|nr:hypothetical protein BKI52_35340 [marine bacterium AO1-C]
MKSKFKLWGDVIAIPLLFFASIVVIIGILIENPSADDMGGVPKEFYIIMMLIANIVVSYQILMNLNFISITDDSISFEHLLLKTKSDYALNDLDGFSTYLMKPNRTSYDVIYVKKNGKTIRRISSRYYENFTELRNFLDSRLKHLKSDV